MLTERRPERVLLVEDSGGDACMFRMAAREVMPRACIVHVSGVGEALRMLEGPSPPPDVIVLDLHLPDGDGFEVLAAVRSAERLRNTPVVVWSASEWSGDVRRSFELGAQLHLVKGPGLHELFACAGAAASLARGCAARRV